MRPSITGEGAPPPRRRPVPQTSNHQHSGMTEPRPVPRQRVMTAVGFVAEPIGRRTLYALIVPRCPTCSGMHFHRSTGPHGGQRRGSCGAGYTVVIAGRGQGLS